ncbi:MAG: AAA family ATPase [Mariniblastus sp.]
MNLTFPVYIKVIKGGHGQKSFYRAALLFFPRVSVDNEDLQRAIVKLRRRAKKRVDELGGEISHEPLANMVFNPEIKTEKLELTIKVGGDFITENFFFVTLKRFGRLFAFCPDIVPHKWFEISEDKQLAERAEEFLKKHFNQKESEANSSSMSRWAAKSQRWITTMDLDVRVNQISRKEANKKMLALWTNEEVNGAVELDKTGRCLDYLYPDDLDLAIGRERESQQLVELLSSEDRRPILIVGEHLVGKTSLVHSAVRQRVEARIEAKGNANSSRQNVWLLAPQRLISGMSYVGQWENRVLAIVRESADRDHVLYFDDLPGLFRAGQSRDSNLSVADLLKTVLQDRSVRILGEITPAAFDVLSELDRSFAEQFHVLRLEPTDVRETYSVAINVTRKFEFENNCTFAVDTIAKAVEFQRQYVRQASFPGKAVRFLKQLAIKFDDYIPSGRVVSEFCESMGVSADIVDDSRSFDREEVRKFFRQGLIGQDAAVEACADMILTAKAKLNAPGKPMATMLFPGPTGVGKTECAKQLAKFLFRGEEQLLRFDLNEFKTSYSAARLIGTADQPEGLLTSAVRRQPFCVILLDEIEKAHPDVFDILLQVTGEGRLTDAIGRTTDFTNAMIVMTSNLGTKRAGQTVGFIDASSEHDYISAAEKFFRPEFFNRIDRVVPFHPLHEDQISKIADLMMNEVVSREGIVRRRCILQVDSGLISRLVTKGYHPDLGARAMKRAIETEFTQPIAARLAAIRSDVPTVIEINSVGSGAADTKSKQRPASRLEIAVHELKNVEPVRRPTTTPDFEELIATSKECLSRLKEGYFQNRPEGEISSDKMSPDLIRYFVLREQADEISDQIRRVREIVDQKKDEMHRPAIATGTRSRGGDVTNRRILVEMNSVKDIHQFVDETISTMKETKSDILPVARNLIDQCSLLESMCKSKIDEAVFFVQVFAPPNEAWASCGTSIHKVLCSFYDSSQFEKLGYEKIDGEGKIVCQRLATTILIHLKGDGLEAFLNQESGAHLACDSAGKLNLIKTGYIASSDEDFQQAKLSMGKENPIEDLTRFLAPHARHNNELKTLRMFEYKGNVIDFRTGSVQKVDAENALSNLMISGMPLSKEFETFCDPFATEPE